MGLPVCRLAPIACALPAGTKSPRGTFSSVAMMITVYKPYSGGAIRQATRHSRPPRSLDHPPTTPLESIPARPSSPGGRSLMTGNPAFPAADNRVRTVKTEGGLS